jgi:hypothetical protein
MGSVEDEEDDVRADDGTCAGRLPKLGLCAWSGTFAGQRDRNAGGMDHRESGMAV